MARHSVDPVDGSWSEVLDQLGEAVIVLDHERILRHVNVAARRLLGYEMGQKVGGRCRLTTRGVDCENACPLTFALETGLDRVEDFATVYQTADGRSVRLRITVIPLTADDGSFNGAVEILRPSDPDPGFFMAGSSSAAEATRRRVADLARCRDNVVVVGETPACRDVALALHRFSGAPDELFRDWVGSWNGIQPWPPGSVFADGDEAQDLLDSDHPDGWRLILGARTSEGLPDGFEIVELPGLDELSSDLCRMIRSWFEQLAPSANLTADALEQLTRLADDRGLEELEPVIQDAAATAGDTVDLADLPLDGYRTALIDELLQTPNPLAALEERLLREVLARCRWRMQDAADRIGVSRVTLWRKMKDLGIERP